MLILIFSSSEHDFEIKMKEYFKEGGSRPDFMLPLANKLKSGELQKRKDPQYLFGILYIITTTTDYHLKEELKDKLLEELVIQIVEQNK